jgi:hypothetical protein
MMVIKFKKNAPVWKAAGYSDYVDGCWKIRTTVARILIRGFDTVKYMPT